jgi:hypothetical protein
VIILKELKMIKASELLTAVLFGTTNVDLAVDMLYDDKVEYIEGPNLEASFQMNMGCPGEFVNKRGWVTKTPFGVLPTPVITQCAVLFPDDGEKTSCVIYKLTGFRTEQMDDFQELFWEYLLDFCDKHGIDDITITDPFVASEMIEFVGSQVTVKSRTAVTEVSIRRDK